MIDTDCGKRNIEGERLVDMKNETLAAIYLLQALLDMISDEVAEEVIHGAIYHLEMSL